MKAVEVTKLTKEYRLGALVGARQAAVNIGRRILGRPITERALFKALDDLSFEIQEGEVVGIIGHNGAGKSTLLKMLARISTPTKGEVKVRGRIAPLIEVGAGFVPDFTGRENVYLNCSILGMSRREIDQKFDEIVEFAEMKEFIDTPVKRYSSGMLVKLAFSVATSVDSEILIVDEVLAVGDLAFQRKCFDRTEQLIRSEGKTVLVVSHNIRQIERMCNRVMLLDHGKLIADGDAKKVCDQFYQRSQAQISANVSKTRKEVHRGRYDKTDDIDLISIEAESEGGASLDHVPSGGDLVIHLRLKCHKSLKNVTIGLGVHTTDFVYLATHNSEASNSAVTLSRGEHEVFVRVKNLPLLPGVYMWRMGISHGEMGKTAFYADNLLQLSVDMPEGARFPSSMREGFFALDAEWEFPSYAKI